MFVAEPDLLQAIEMHSKGIPIGRPAEVNLRNNHAQYIFTWYVVPSFLFTPCNAILILCQVRLGDCHIHNVLHGRQKAPDRYVPSHTDEQGVVIDLPSNVSNETKVQHLFQVTSSCSSPSIFMRLAFFRGALLGIGTGIRSSCRSSLGRWR